MAYTVSGLASTVFGNERVLHLQVTADGVSGVVATGLNYIYTCQATINSMVTTTAMRIKINTGAASAVVNGSLFISSVGGNGDVFFLTVYGR